MKTLLGAVLVILVGFGAAQSSAIAEENQDIYLAQDYVIEEIYEETYEEVTEDYGGGEEYVEETIEVEETYEETYEESTYEEY